jgi:GNAT superfamily N-acetyltransferase
MTDPVIRIRRAETADQAVIVEFNRRLARETEGRELHAEVVEEGVRRALSLGDESQYFVAEDGSGVVGQVLLTREWSDWQNGWRVWLQSVYVREDRRGQGVFKRLLSVALAEVSTSDRIIGTRLYVEQHNDRAKQVYRQLGFCPTGYEVMECGSKE